MRSASFMLALIVAAVAFPVGRAGDDARELEALAGLWQARYDEPPPPGLVNAHIPNGPSSITLIVQANGKLEIRGPRPGTESLQARLVVHPAGRPKTMDIEVLSGPHKGKKQYAIYDLKPGKTEELDTLILVVADLGAKEKDRPKSLKAGQPKTVRYEFARAYIRTIE